MSDDPNSYERITYCGGTDEHEWPMLDEVVLYNATIHIERMDDGLMWIGITKGDDEWHDNLFTNPRGRAVIYGRVEKNR